MLELVVDTSGVLARLGPDAVGINVDYLRDADSNRPAARPLEEALREMGARRLRFPGGGKSDFHLWSAPPFDRPAPQIFGRYRQWAEGYEVMDFDQFAALAGRAGTEPYVVVGCYRQDRTCISRQQYLENAVQWVRYSKAKRRGVRYWEIGNENWLNQTAAPEEVAETVIEFSRAMKAADPGILIGASGFDPSWWEKFLPKAAADIDFLVVSVYPCSGWMGYDHYRTHAEVTLDAQARHAAEAVRALGPPHRERLFVAAAELNSMDYAAGGWPNRNNLGHALVTVEIIGQLLLCPLLRFALLWNTRWVDPEPEAIWYALDTRNRLLPAGRALAAWGQFVGEALVACERTDAVVTFASLSAARGTLAVLLTNKDNPPAEITLAVRAGETYRSARAFRLHGAGPDDMHPAWEELPPPAVRANRIEGLELPGVSLTAVCLTQAASRRRGIGP